MNAILTAVLLTLLSALAQPALAQSPPATVEVHEFTVTGNTLLPASSLQASLAPFKGRRSLTELKQAAQAVQDLYARAGYGGVVAYLPEQAGPAGSATIAVLEGRISQVTVSGNKQFSEANIRRSLPLLAEGQTPQVLRIDAQIQQANENPAKQVAVSLEPGKSQGEVNVSINVQELPASRWTLNADNTGNERTGRWRSTLGYSNAALWDLDHSLNLQFQTAPEKIDAVRVFSAGYRIPLYDWGASLDLFAAYSNVDGGSSSTVAGPLQFSGKGRVLGLRLTEYLARQGEIDQRLIIGLDQRAYLNSCAIAGLPDGACGTAGESVTVQPLTVEFTAQRGGERPAGLNIALLHNLGLGGRVRHSAGLFERHTRASCWTHIKRPRAVKRCGTGFGRRRTCERLSHRRSGAGFAVADIGGFLVVGHGVHRHGFVHVYPASR